MWHVIAYGPACGHGPFNNVSGGEAMSASCGRGGSHGKWHGLPRSFSLWVGLAMMPVIALQAAEAPSATGSSGLEEIVVTARKVTENLQNVPTSITALSGAQLDERGITAVSQVFQAAPNVEFDSSGFLFSSQLTIRGVRSNDTYAGWETANGIILDDVYIGRSAAFNIDLLDVQQLAVLRGPQGTLQGKNIIGGAMQIISAPPSNTLGGAVTVEGGSNDLRAVRGYVTGPVSDTVSVKLSFTGRQQDGFTRDTVTGHTLGDVNSWGLRGQLLWTPTSQFRALVTLDGSRDHGTDNNSVYTGPGEVITPFTPTALSRNVMGDFDSQEHRHIFGTTVHLDYDLNDSLRLTSVSAYRTFSIDEVAEQDGLPQVLVNSGVSQVQSQWSQELRTTYTTPGLTAIGGLYYYRETLEDVTQIYENIPLLAGFPFAIPAFGLVPINNEDRSRNVSSSYAAFGSVTKDLIDRFSLTAGVRATHDDLTTRITDAALIDPALGYPGTPPAGTAFPSVQIPTPIPVPLGDGSVKNTEFTGDFSLTYKFNPDVSVYAKYARGYKGGGFQTGLPTLPDVLGSPVKPEFVNDYELGLRSMLADRRIRFNLTGYYMTWIDRQAFRVSIVNGVPLEFAYNDPKARIYGFELESDFQVTPDLTFSVNAGSADTKFTRSDDPTIQGNAFGGVSPYTASVVGNYVHRISDGWNLRLIGDARWADEYPLRDDNLTPGFVQPSYWLVNASLGVERADGHFSVQLWGRNLTNEDVFVTGVAGVPSPGSGPGVPGPPRSNGVLRDPRTWGLQATYRF